MSDKFALSVIILIIEGMTENAPTNPVRELSESHSLWDATRSAAAARIISGF